MLNFIKLLLPTPTAFIGGGGMGGMIGAAGGFMLGGPAGGAVGYSVGSGFDQANAQQQANKANRKMAKDQMKFQSAQTKQQMDFQERMSSTAYQRSTQDLKEAGLNPMLAYQQGGASSPVGAAGSGATAQMVPEDPSNHAMQALSTALETKRLKKDIQIAEAQIENVNADTAKKRTENTLLEKDEPMAEIKNDVGKAAKKLYEGAVNSGKKIKKYFQQQTKPRMNTRPH